MSIKTASQNFISSWSGGKDSCLAFFYAIQAGLMPKYLMNMVTDAPMPLLKKQFVYAQAKSMNVPINIGNTTWKTYEEDFINLLKKTGSEAEVDICVFGDMDIERHKQWNEDICRIVGLKPFIPLWKKRRREIMLEFISLGFKATINVIDSRYLGESFLGREINISLIQDLENENIDICGELGEYHTVVTDGPIFSYPLTIQKKGAIRNNCYCYLDFDIRDNI